jgi:hypothetical protein
VRQLTFAIELKTNLSTVSNRRQNSVIAEKEISLLRAMTDKAIEQHITKMVVLGGRFQLGDLYDYRNDSILAGTKNSFTQMT